MILVHEGRASTFTDAQRIARDLRSVWKRPNYTVRVTGRFVGTGYTRREFMIRLYRRN